MNIWQEMQSAQNAQIMKLQTQTIQMAVNVFAKHVMNDKELPKTVRAKIAQLTKERTPREPNAILQLTRSLGVIEDNKSVLIQHA